MLSSTTHSLLLGSLGVAVLVAAQVTQPAALEVPPPVPTTSISLPPDRAVPLPKTTTPPAEEFQAARPNLISKRERVAQLQIFLDKKLFSPGMIDGKEGRFLVEALKRWQRANGMPDTGQLDTKVPIEDIYPVYTFHVVEAAEFKRLGDVPKQPSAQAQKKKLPYTSYDEFLAERYHCSTDFLQGLNPKMDFSKLAPGAEVRVPNVEPFKIEEMPETGNFPENPELKERRIVINRKATILELYEADKLIASVPIAPGSPAHPTPPGNWKILGVAAMPTFRWDKGVLEAGKRTSNFHMLPPGPNNPVGVGWIGLNKPGIGIHGTNNPYSIGTWASHGCMRTANWDISRISKMVTNGVQVEIQ
jgi:lipoprotein-anchoring transpeptidase ErfK/SrfK